LEFIVCLSPALFPIQHNSIPEKVASRDVFWFGVGRQPEWLVNFVPLLRIHSTEKIDRPSDNMLARELESAWTNQNARSVKAIRDTESARQFHRLARGEEGGPFTALKRRHDDRAGANAYVDITFTKKVTVVLLA